MGATTRHQLPPSTAPVTSDGLRRNQLALESLIAAAGTAGVLTFNSRSGSVTLLTADVILALGLSLAGNPGKVVTVNAGATALELQPPAAASALLFPATAGEAVSGNRAARFEAGSVYHADQSLASATLTVGVTTGAAALGAGVTVQTEGVMVEPSWAWATGPVWLGLTGLLTQTIPTTGVLVRIGTAISATKLRIAPLVIAQL